MATKKTVDLYHRRQLLLRSEQAPAVLQGLEARVVEEGVGGGRITNLWSTFNHQSVSSATWASCSMLESKAACLSGPMISRWNILRSLYLPVKKSVLVQDETLNDLMVMVPLLADSSPFTMAWIPLWRSQISFGTPSPSPIRERMR